MRVRFMLSASFCALSTVLLLGSTAVHAAQLRFSRHFSDGMVVQRDKPVTVSGVADKGATVTVAFAGQTQSAKADADGAWSVKLDPVPANAKSQNLVATSSVGNQKSTLGNVVIGDVFLVARQTSIDISLGRDAAGQKAAKAHKKTPLYRTIAIKTIPSAEPQSDLAEEATSGWSVVDKDAALNMSAAAFYLGRDLAAEVDVPVGIIDLNLGSAFPLSWLSREALDETEKFYGKSDVPGQVSYHDQRLEAEAKGEPMPKQKVAPSNTVHRALFPAGGYNAVINPLRGLALKAAMIQLGNDYPYMIYAGILASDAPFNRPALNTAYVDTYMIRKVGFRMEPVTTPRVPREWRKALGDSDLPIGLIAPPGSDLNTMGQHHREMRELQRLTAASIAGVDVILAGSENIPYSAQPQDEALLAARALGWVRGAVYQQADAPATGPRFERLELNMNQATVIFAEGTAKGLRASGDALDVFEVAAVEGDYAPAKARIDGEVIRIESDTVNRISRVRYNWNKRPDQGLVNAAGLPAIPFRSEKADYGWFVTNKDDDLPSEYYTPANAWKKSDVTLINAQLKTHGYGNFTGWIGPAGFKTGPFGPNMGVREIKAGSPAEGKLLVGDVIYSVNGTMLGEKAWEVMGAAITESETTAAKGKLVLGVRRGAENLDVELTLEVMGSYSSTAPYDCLKTEKIIRQLEEWVVARGAGAGFLNTDALFLLATGNPEMQGYVRRIVYGILGKEIPTTPIDGTKAGKSWHNSAEAILLGEYYMATGDKNVLGHLKYACDRLAATQNKEYGGWRHNFPGGATYGLIPNAGLPGVLGMYCAKEAGVDIDIEAYRKGVKHFSDKRADSGFLIYGYGPCTREVPPPLNPEEMNSGHMETANGGVSAASILMKLDGNHRGAHLASLLSAYAWNNTFHGHGGNFWNNFWTPLGAYQHSRPAFINFWKHHRWYRESNRMFDGSLIQHESGKVGAGCGVALVAPRERLQITGAPASPFATNAPVALKAALAAYGQRDYAGCEKLVTELIASGTVAKDDMPTVEYLARAAGDMQASIAADVARIEALCSAGNAKEASTFVAGLKGIVAEGDPCRAEVEKLIAAAKPAPAPKADPKAKQKVEDEPEPPRKWECLVMEADTGGKRKGKADPNLTLKSEPEVWKMQVVEGLSQAPEGWMDPKFDDKEWLETTLPISWRMYHTALLRTTFNVKDKKAFDGLRLRAWVFRQQGIEIYLNGEIIGKINNIEKKTGDIQNDFKASALKHLKNGENTLAVTTRHNWRWGMLFMSVYNDGFDFNLDARVK